MKKTVFISQINQKAPVGSPSCVVGIIIDGEKYYSLIGEVQGFKEHGNLCWAAHAFDELSDFGAGGADVVRAVLKLTLGKVLKG